MGPRPRCGWLDNHKEPNASRKRRVPGPKSRSSVFWRLWRPPPRGQTFKRPPASVCDLDERNLDLRVEILHGLNPYRCEFALDEIGHRLKLEPEGKQGIHVAATRRNCQDFEQLSMSLGERLRSHFGFP